MTIPHPSPTDGDPFVKVRILPPPLDVGSTPDHGGGACTFEGITRPDRHPEKGELIALRYEAAEPLTTRRLEALATGIARAHGLHRLEVQHAIGEVPVGRASVRITAVADHRDAAFAACRETIDRLKSEIPIWKQECWVDGSTWSEAATPLPEALEGVDR